MSRLRILFATAALFALATAFAACGGGDSNEKPQAVVDNATLAGIRSADLDLSLDLKATGEGGGDLEVSLAGPFQSDGAGELPQLDMAAKVSGKLNGEDVDFDAGLVLLPNSAYVNYEGTDYEVDPTTFSFVESAIKQAQQQGGAEKKSGDLTACQEAAGKLEIGSFAGNLSNEGSADVGGTSTTKVSGDLDVNGAIGSLIELAGDPACSAQLGAAGPLPSTAELNQAKGEIESAIKTAQVDLYVGDDDIVRRISAQLKIEPRQDGNGPESVDLSFDLTLTGVNEEQQISAPERAKPLNDLFLKLGVNPIELLQTFEGEGEGLGGLLEGLGGVAGGGSGGGSPGGGGSGSGGQQAYLKCLQGVTSAADLQKCNELR